MSGRLVITCEHGGHDIPREFSRHFRGRSRWLTSHRGWDPGALALATDLALTTGAPLLASTVSRLLVDLNRSETSATLWSSVSRDLDAQARNRVLERHYRPYRRDVIALVQRLSRRHRAVHVSVHSFTPVLRGVRRELEIGVLFDPARRQERAVATTLSRELRKVFPRWRVQFNQPYKGTDDGLTTHIRTLLPDARYAGIEIEVNQRLVRAASWNTACTNIAAALARALHSHE